MKIALIGFGAVGQGVARALVEKREILRKFLGDYRVVAITDSMGGLADEDGVDLKRAIEIKRRNGRLPEGVNSIDVIEGMDIDVCVEMTPTNIEDGEPGLTHIERCLKILKRKDRYERFKKKSSYLFSVTLLSFDC